MTLRVICLTALLWTTQWNAALVRADLAVVKTGDSVVDANALTIDGGFGQAINGLSFQQDAVVTHRGFQYVGYYDGSRRVCLARRKLPAGPWRVVRFADYEFKSNDAHNIISIGICPQDGTIHIAFDHHGHPLHYRASRPGVATDPEAVTWDVSLFGPDPLGPGKGQADSHHLSPLLADANRRPAVLLSAGRLGQWRSHAG